MYLLDVISHFYLSRFSLTSAPQHHILYLLCKTAACIIHSVCDTGSRLAAVGKVKKSLFQGALCAACEQLGQELWKPCFSFSCFKLSGRMICSSMRCDISWTSWFVKNKLKTNILSGKMFSNTLIKKHSVGQKILKRWFMKVLTFATTLLVHELLQKCNNT